jgi:hypothetical protein
MLGVTAIVLPSIRTDGWRAIFFAIWLGGSMGLGLGALARQIGDLDRH